MSRKKIIIGVILLVIVIAAIWYLFFNKPKEVPPVTVVTVPNSNNGSGTTSTPASTPKVTTNSTTTNTTVTAVTGNDNFPLQIGSNGTRVALLQAAMVRIKPTLSFPNKGVFDAALRTAVLAYVGTTFYPVTANNYGSIQTKSMIN